MNPLISPTDLAIPRTICNYTETSRGVKPPGKRFLGDFLSMWKRKKSRSFGGLSQSGLALVALVLRSFRVFLCRLSGPRRNYTDGTRVSDGLSKMFVSVDDQQTDNVAFVCLGAKLRQRGGKLRVDMLCTEAMA